MKNLIYAVFLGLILLSPLAHAGNLYFVEIYISGKFEFIEKRLYTPYVDRKDFKEGEKFSTDAVYNRVMNKLIKNGFTENNISMVTPQFTELDTHHEETDQLDNESNQYDRVWKKRTTSFYSVNIGFFYNNVLPMGLDSDYQTIKVKVAQFTLQDAKVSGNFQKIHFPPLVLTDDQLIENLKKNDFGLSDKNLIWLKAEQEKYAAFHAVPSTTLKTKLSVFLMANEPSSEASLSNLQLLKAKLIHTAFIDQSDATRFKGQLSLQSLMRIASIKQKINSFPVVKKLNQFIEKFRFIKKRICNKLLQPKTE